MVWIHLCDAMAALSGHWRHQTTCACVSTPTKVAEILGPGAQCVRRLDSRLVY